MIAPWQLSCRRRACRGSRSRDKHWERSLGERPAGRAPACSSPNMIASTRSSINSPVTNVVFAHRALISHFISCSKDGIESETRLAYQTKLAQVAQQRCQAPHASNHEGGKGCHYPGHTTPFPARPCSQLCYTCYHRDTQEVWAVSLGGCDDWLAGLPSPLNLQSVPLIRS